MRLLSLGSWCAAGALALIAACAFPDFQFDPAETGGGSSTSTGSGGTGGSATGGTGGSSSGQAGAGGAVCDLHQPGGCGPGHKCTVVDLDTGAIGCGLAGTKQIWQRCNVDSDCVEGSWCDQQLNVCKPWCQGMTDCDFGGTYQGECVPAQRANGTDIPGNPTHCTSNCEPISGGPCDTADSVTCVFVGSGVFDCALTENHTVTTDCTTSQDCAAGLVCVGVPNGVCRYWCTPTNDLSCNLLGFCAPLNPKVYYNSVEYGACS